MTGVLAFALFACVAGLLYIWNSAERELTKLTRERDSLTADLKAVVTQRDRLLVDLAAELIGRPVQPSAGLVRCYDQFGQLVVIPFADLPVAEVKH